MTYNPRYKNRIKDFLSRLNPKKLWHLDNGDWDWIKEQQTPIAELNRDLWRLSVPFFSFHFMLSLSVIIATLGLLANSAAVIIGAMIVVPSSNFVYPNSMRSAK